MYRCVREREPNPKWQSVKVRRQIIFIWPPFWFINILKNRYDSIGLVNIQIPIFGQNKNVKIHQKNLAVQNSMIIVLRDCWGPFSCEPQVVGITWGKSRTTVRTKSRHDWIYSYINMHLSISTLSDLGLAMFELSSLFINRRLPLAKIFSANQKTACLRV